MAIRLSTDMPSSLFDHVKTAEPNAVFRLNAKFGKDANTDKLNLGIGAFRDDFGNTVVMDVVKKEEHDMAVEIGDGRMNHEYPAMGGSAGLVRLSAELLLGQNSATIKNDLVHGVQTVSGTGALKVAADFLARHHDERVVYISDPTWENHRRIFAEAGHEVRKYRYYDDETRGLDMGGLMEDLSEAPPGAVVVMHACAHNPTGVDLTPNEWRELAELCQARRFVVVFDSAYLGLVTGNPERDAHALRLFDSMGLTFFVCKSYSKIFGLYSERCGVALFRGSTAAECKAVNSQLKVITRGIWSVPPMHGAHIVERILGDPKKNKAWRAELKSMSDRIARTRQQLYNELTRRDPEGSWTHVIEQGGMFTYTGLSPQQCDVLKRDNHIYMLRSGRINVSGIPADQVARLAAAICEAKRKTTAADAASAGIDAAAAADVSVATAAATPLPSDADSINSVEAFEGESSGDDAASGPAN